MNPKGLVLLAHEDTSSTARHERHHVLLLTTAVAPTDNRRRDLSFEPEDYVYLRVTPLRGVKRFHAKGKLAPRYVGPFKILERRGEVAYQLELPQSLAGVHDVFHVSQLKKCLRVPEEQAPLESIKFK